MSSPYQAVVERPPPDCFQAPPSSSIYFAFVVTAGPFDQEGDFAFRGTASDQRDQLLQGPPVKFFVVLSEFPGQHRPPIAQACQERGQQLVDAMRALEQDHGGRVLAETRNPFCPGPLFARQEAFKTKRVAGEAGPCKGGQDG